MAIRIPLDDLAANPGGVSFTIDLAGDVFGLTIRYNDRDQRYYLTVADEDGSIIVDTVKVLRSIPLLDRVVDSRRPKGDILAVDVGASGEPTIATLGDGVDLVFVPWSESLA